MKNSLVQKYMASWIIASNPRALTLAQHALLLVLFWLALLLPADLEAQAPAVLWSTNIGARVFAVDVQTNVYADTSNSIIVLNAQGVPFQTNVFCPVPGIAQRDTAGNFYFAGSFIPPQDFGGVILTNNRFFLAKYTSAGTLLWAVSFFPGAPYRMSLQDFQVDTEGNAYVGYIYAISTSHYSSSVTKFNASGTNLWTATLPKADWWVSTVGNVRLGSVSPSNCYAISFTDEAALNSTFLSKIDANGVATAVAQWPYPGAPAQYCERPITDSFQNLYYLGVVVYQYQPMPALIKQDIYGSIVWTQRTGGWTLAADKWDNVYVADQTGRLAHYDSDGTLSWSMTLPSYCHAMVLDTNGNRFLSLSNGAVARLIPRLLHVKYTGFSSEGLGLSLISDTPRVFEVFVSTNLDQWQSLRFVTNSTGKVQFTDPGPHNSPARFYKALSISP